MRLFQEKCKKLHSVLKIASFIIFKMRLEHWRYRAADGGTNKQISLDLETALTL